MGTGYTRNDAANNIADGNIINASDLDGEFDAVEAAFNSTTGHTHDGTSAEGAPIEVIGPTQDVVITASVMRPKTTNTVDLGTSSLEFKDAYFDGTITTDALTVTDGITSDTVTISSDNAGAAKGPQLDIFRDSASPADSDVLGYIDFSGKDDGDNKTIYASILAEAADVTDTTEDGVLKFNTMVDGSDTTTMTITESRVGIGESSPDTLLHLTGTSTAYTTVTMEQTDTTLTADQPVGQFLFKQNDASGVGTPAKFGAYAEGTSGEVGFRFSTGSGNTASERMRIDSSGRVLIGTSSSRRTSGGERQFQIEGTTGVTSSMSITRNTNSTTAPSITLAKTRGTSVGDNTIVIDGDTVGQIVFSAADGTDADSRVAEIEAFIDGTPGANDTPGSLVFSTTADGAASTTERMRIDSSGQVGIGTSSPDSLLHLSNSDATAYSGTATDGQVGVGPTIYLENPANANTTVGGQIVFGMRSTEEQARIAATGGTNPAITFGTADAERMRIDSSGNVGVGTSSPSEQINLVGSGGTSKIRFDGDSSNLQNNFIGITGYDDLVIASDEANSATASTIQFRVDATERMRIDSSGKARQTSPCKWRN
jgi:hypothetical protein